MGITKLALMKKLAGGSGGSSGEDSLFVQLIKGTIETINDDTITEIRTSAFYDCTSLKSVYMSNVSIVQSGAFTRCYGLEYVNLPKAKEFTWNNFYLCDALKHADFGALEKIEGSAFKNCSVLETMIIRTNKVCTLSSVNVFAYSPFNTAGKSGTLYVPQALIESYQNATNWSTLYANGTCNFVAIEGSEYE